MSDLENRIKIIEARNNKVTSDKKWETSVTRRVAILIFTYISVVIFLLSINNERPFVNALIPVFGFLLSTLSLKSIRKLWEKT